MMRVEIQLDREPRGQDQGFDHGAVAFDHIAGIALLARQVHTLAKAARAAQKPLTIGIRTARRASEVQSLIHGLTRGPAADPTGLTLQVWPWSDTSASTGRAGASSEEAAASIPAGTLGIAATSGTEEGASSDRSSATQRGGAEAMAQWIIPGNVLFGEGVVQAALGRLPTIEEIAQGIRAPWTIEDITPHLRGTRTEFVCNIVGEDDKKIAKQRIFETVTKDSSGWISKNINARFSIPLSKRISEYPITPNMITAFGALVGITAGPVIASGTVPGLVIGGTLFQISTVLDRCDGEIARAKFQASRQGAWIDTMGDNLTYLSFVLGLTFGTHASLLRRTGITALVEAQAKPDWVLPLGLGMVAALLLLLGVMYGYAYYRKTSGCLVDVSDDLRTRLKGNDRPRLFGWLEKIKFVGKRDFFSMAIFAASFTGSHLFMFWGAIIVVAGLVVHFLVGLQSAIRLDRRARSLRPT